MWQPFLSGLEDYLSPNDKFPEEDAIGIVDRFEEKGYAYLLDWTESSYYIPYRIKLSSGKVLDEEELFSPISILNRKGFNPEEIINGRYYFLAINSLDLDEILNGRPSFLNSRDERRAIKKYGKH